MMTALNLESASSSKFNDGESTDGLLGTFLKGIGCM